MPDLKITQFSQIVTLDDTDVLAIVDLTDNTTKKVTVAQLKALATFISLTTTGTSGAATLIGGVLNVPQYQAAISLTTTGSSGAATLIGSTLNIPQYATSAGGSNGEIQYNNGGGGAFGGALDFVWDDINNFLGVGIATPIKKIHVVDVANQCVGLFKSGQVGSVIAFMDISTLDADQVGVGAFDNFLCLRGGGNVAGTIQIGNDFADFRGNQLTNFIPSIFTDAIGVTIDSTNEDSYCATVLEVTGAITVTIDDSVRDGFNISIIQMDANNCTFAASGGSLTLQNRQGHTQTNGQWATVTLFKNGNNLILAGDTV
jgi:hypothetical protein